MCDVDVRRCSRELIPAVVRRPSSPSIPTDAAAGPEEKSPQRGHHLGIVRLAVGRGVGVLSAQGGVVVGLEATNGNSENETVSEERFVVQRQKRLCCLCNI